MRMICKRCRWWQKVKVDAEPTCNCVDSDNRFDETDAEYSCNHFAQEVEQDGDATWYLEQPKCWYTSKTAKFGF